MNIKRIFVEKKPGYNVEAQVLLNELKDHLLIESLENVRVIHRYDVESVDEKIFRQALTTVFSEPPLDTVFEEEISVENNNKYFAVEYLPGQYDQRADSASQCIQILTQDEKPKVKYAKVIILSGQISDSDFDSIRRYIINPVDSREASLEKPSTLDDQLTEPADVETIKYFTEMDDNDLEKLLHEMGLAMDLDDLQFCQDYFRDEELRNPTVTELRILDTYWSDHCRHTTFLTKIDEVEFDDGPISGKIKETYTDYLKSREFVYGDSPAEKDICLMDIATIAMKELKKKGMLKGLDESEEINACSIEVKVDVAGREEDWLVMFKNETHNHPTEIEPFGGAATCLGGAIRDPLSGRAYVYQAMRVSGSGDPRIPINDTIEGKLPQRKITTEAAHGYSSYGNQIGLSTGLVDEIYHEGYVAKRMEIGAVIAAVPRYNVVRVRPSKGDVIILLGGRTGRDGCGGATGSSKAHTEDSIITCGAEVQKGNAPEERKIQRLFRDPKVTRMIKRCNDFGAGGVSVAIGELADGLEIFLDRIPKKYDGLDGTELAISESQERMACLVSPANEIAFKKAAERENLEATTVAYVNDESRIKMYWRGKTIVNISREFLNSNGAKKHTKVRVSEPETDYKPPHRVQSDIKSQWLDMLSDLNVCSKKGLVERFDNCVGAATVNYPFGGKYQLTPTESMCAKIPVLNEETTTGTLMSYGFDPGLSSWSPFHGAMYAVIESLSKIVTSGGDYRTTWFTFQEYFERLGTYAEKWGKPFSALLGAYYAQLQFKRAAIGGKDSMSGSFKNLDVPPTLVSFAVDTVDLYNILSPEFKQADSKVIYLEVIKDDLMIPDFSLLKSTYERITELIKADKIIAAHTVGENGPAEAISKMCFGNMLGFELGSHINPPELFEPGTGGVIVEISKSEIPQELFADLQYSELGRTTAQKNIVIDNITISLDEAINSWKLPLEDIFPTQVALNDIDIPDYKFTNGKIISSELKYAKPRVLIPAFPGTNSEYDSMKAFNQAGAEVNILPIRNLTSRMIDETIHELAGQIKNSQIVFIPGGFSAGDEPEGSGKFIAAMFRNPMVKDAVNDLLENRDGLMLGICNGFQALIKLGLVPYGEIMDINEDSPTLTFNKIGRHISKIIYTKVVSDLSPWLANVELDTVQAVPVSHGEGRFVANDQWIEKLRNSGQIATQYVDFNGNPSMDIFFNPNSSYFAVEGITSPDGRIFGKMGHNERLGNFVGNNIPGNKEIKLFKAGVEYFQ
ncbi:MAG: phosphoribosylformylglycinamidine synthase [Melioribacteraceae bacterium]|nr:phosphoribosylformylglycinamidine synthase [Melioribacteraceae bacterium]